MSAAAVAPKRLLFNQPLEDMKISVSVVAFGDGWAITGLLYVGENLIFAAPTIFEEMLDIDTNGAAAIRLVSDWLATLPVEGATNV